MTLTRRSFFGLFVVAATAKALPAPTKVERALEQLTASPALAEGWKLLNLFVPSNTYSTCGLQFHPLTYTLTTTSTAEHVWPHEYIVVNNA